MRKGSGFAIDAWHENEIADVLSSCLRAATLKLPEGQLLRKNAALFGPPKPAVV
jgi:hypothetical protein